MNWQEKAGQVATAIPPSRLHPAVQAWRSQHRGRGPWAIAFSGGADSLALLLAVRGHWPAQAVVVLHFNHRLRGRAATADAQYCRRVCRELGVRCVVGAWREARRDASEAEAREARQSFFAREMKTRRCGVLWLAHQQDDIAESMLMRLARGSGAGGLAAPRPVQTFADGRTFLRPLLALKKAELIQVLKKAGAVWREDGTNGAGDFFRNRVRQSVVPAWVKAAGRDAGAGAARSRELLEEDELALELWVDQARALKRGVLDVTALRGLPRAVVRRALHRWLLAVRPETDLSRAGFALLLAAVERGTATKFSLGRRGFAVIRQGKLAYRKD